MNNTPETIRPLEVLSLRALSGLVTIGAVINLKANDLATVAPVVYDLFGRPADPTATPPIAEIKGKQPLYKEANALHAFARASLKVALAEGRDFMVQAVDSLRGPLGRRWNASWEPIGFTAGSLELPSNPVPVLTMLGAHFRAHPERELAARNITSARAEQLKAAIVAAQTAVDAAHDVEKAAKLARDAAKKNLRFRLGALRDELHGVLTQDDSRWYRFGFRRPVDGETPDLVAELRLRLGAPGDVNVEWPKARLADNYRVSWKLTGSTAEPTQVGIFSDPQAVISGLPHCASITVVVTARNGAGESAPMEAAIAVP